MVSPWGGGAASLIQRKDAKTQRRKEVSQKIDPKQIKEYPKIFQLSRDATIEENEEGEKEGREIVASLTQPIILRSIVNGISQLKIVIPLIVASTEKAGNVAMLLSKNNINDQSWDYLLYIDDEVNSVDCSNDQNLQNLMKGEVVEINGTECQLRTL